MQPSSHSRCTECWADPCFCNGVHISTPPLPPLTPSRPPLPSKHSSSSYTSFYSLSLHPPSLSSKIFSLSFLATTLSLGFYNPTRLTPLARWRARRKSVKELRQEEAAVHEEYLRMREVDARVMRAKPPSYGVVVGESEESAVGLERRTGSGTGMGMGMGTRTSSTSAESGMGTTRTVSENGSQTSGSTR